MTAAALTPEAIEKLKAEHGEIFIIEVKVSADDTAVAYLKPADRNVMAIALQKVAKDQMVEPGEVILTNCFVAGDERLKLPTGLAVTRPQIAAAVAAVALVKTMEVTIKNG